MGQVGSPEETKFHIAITSSFYGSQPLGQEMLLNFARHMAAAYAVGEPILKNSVLHFIPNIDEHADKMIRQYDGTDKCSLESLEEEFGDSLYSYLTKKDLNPLTNYTREKAFINMLEAEKYDLLLELSSGKEVLAYPELCKNMFEQYAQRYQENRTPSDKYSCAVRTPIHGDLIDVLYERFNTPVLSAGLSCCKMPVDSEIGFVWRNNLKGINDFVKLANTGEFFQNCQKDRTSP